MFAEDVDLLPNKMFKRMLEHAATRPDEFQSLASDLFNAMKSGGRIGFEHVAWFNGGLFNDDTALALNTDDIALTLVAAKLDWAEIDPSILGTLFERGLDPDKRSQLGAHYTDREKIMMIVDPVIVQPWLAEWAEVKATIAAAMSTALEAQQRTPERQSDARKIFAAARRAEEVAKRSANNFFINFLDRLKRFRVLDPACGSGNFLNLALLALKDIEHRANIEAELLGLTRQAPGVGPEAVLGIEINPYAAELARVSVWIGEIQWMRRNGFGVSDQPILQPLDNIECRDAILNTNGTEASWPEADAVIGNPPFLGDKFMRDGLGIAYTETLRSAYSGRVPGGADLACYWFEKARGQITTGVTRRAGLVSTNSIRGGANRVVLDRIVEKFSIFDAWADEEWTVDGAAVRVSLVCFGAKGDVPARSTLNGIAVNAIFSDLTAGRVDLTVAAQLTENSDVAFIGNQKGGAFDIPGELARRFIQLPNNPNGRPNSDVVRPWINGLDIVRRPRDFWIIDFTELSELEASLYEKPFEYIVQNVKTYRTTEAHHSSKAAWWLHQRPRYAFRKAVAELDRYIATARVAKHRLFVWCPTSVVPDSQVVAIARDDDTVFGILHSRFHEAWSLKLCTWLGVGNDPRYTPSTTFETFPFPLGLTPNILASVYATDPRAVRIADAVKRLDELREAWLHPPGLTNRAPEVVSGFPDRLLPVDAKAAAILKKRTLTNLYNVRPTWLANAHADLDAAVAEAYGWSANISEEEALASLFALNQARAASQVTQGELVADANGN
jgi:type II restriction/modification system DNA methylase subunit YeeA